MDFSQRIGPLPLWGWGLVTVGGLIVGFTILKGRSSSKVSADIGSAPSGVPPAYAPSGGSSGGSTGTTTTTTTPAVDLTPILTLIGTNQQQMQASISSLNGAITSLANRPETPVAPQQDYTPIFATLGQMLQTVLQNQQSLASQPATVIYQPVDRTPVAAQPVTNGYNVSSTQVPAQQITPTATPQVYVPVTANTSPATAYERAVRQSELNAQQRTQGPVLGSNANWNNVPATTINNAGRTYGPILGSNQNWNPNVRAPIGGNGSQ